MAISVEGEVVEERGGPLSLLTAEVLLWTAENIAAPIALRLAEAVAKRIARYRAKKKATSPLVVRVLYHADGSELARVEVPDVEEH